MDASGPQVAGAADQPRDSDLYQWRPYIQRSPRMRVVATSCCGKFELCSEGGQYFVLRPAGDGHEETARGRFARAARVWEVLASQHSCAEYEPPRRRRWCPTR